MSLTRHPHVLATYCCYLIVPFLCGCSRELSTIHPPAYNANAGSAAITAYDVNQDQNIGGAELERVPGLKASLSHVDTNGDGLITASEIDARVKQWLHFRIGEMPVRCEVTLDDVPLADAQVVLEPEPFLGSAVHAAQGVSSANGTAGISMAKEHLADARYPGVACGWYKIRVTSASHALPTRYNTETTLGCEVAMDAEWVNHGAVQLTLTTK